jgi:hypothetical protein
MNFCGIFSRLSVIYKKVRVLVRLHENDFGAKQRPWTLHVFCEDPLLTRTEKISKQGSGLLSYLWVHWEKLWSPKLLGTMAGHSRHSSRACSATYYFLLFLK